MSISVLRPPHRATFALSGVGALIVSTLVAFVGLRAIGSVNWPAFNSSNVSYALTTAGQTIAVILLVIAVVLYRMGRSPWVVRVLSWLGISGFATVSLAMPLGATKLYLFGISVDQQFRTEYLTRLTDSVALRDMTYAGLPPFYPAGWFWLGGRYATVTGQPGWEAYKPWSILTIAVAATLALVLWKSLVRTDIAIAASLATTIATLMYASPEPYGAILVVLGVPMLAIMVRALKDGHAGAIIGSGVFLGISATFYTLFTGIYALSAVVMALYLAVDGWLGLSNKTVADVRSRRLRATTTIALRLAAMGAISAAIALIAWAPYLWARLANRPASGGTFEHYLPQRGSLLPMPMFEWSLMGALCLIGIVWLLLRFRANAIALALLCATVSIYAFCFLSMLATAAGTTLLAFRLEPVLVAILSAAGVMGAVELAQWMVAKFGDIRLVIGVLTTALAIAVAQGIPTFLSTEITIAYTDTDGAGNRADQRPPGAESYFAQIHSEIGKQTGRPADQTVVLTADYGFLAVYPYLGFQGLTSHYANPLAEFDKRAARIEQWAKSESPQQLIDELNTSPWQPPTVFLFRYSADGYDLQLATDVYPNDPNVKRYTVSFNPSAFADPRFTVTTVGPFVLVVRK